MNASEYRVAEELRRRGDVEEFIKPQGVINSNDHKVPQDDRTFGITHQGRLRLLPQWAMWSFFATVLFGAITIAIMKEWL
jgi:hypothetical protein